MVKTLRKSLEFLNEVRDFYFESEQWITYINLRNSLTIIGNSAFANCSNLNNINIPPNLNIMNYNPFWGCTKLIEFKNIV